jgi:integrase
MTSLGDARREQYATLILLAAASGLRVSELLALRVNDIDLKTGTIRVDESSDQRNNGAIGPCKNAALIGLSFSVTLRVRRLRGPSGGF